MPAPPVTIPGSKHRPSNSVSDTRLESSSSSASLSSTSSSSHTPTYDTSMSSPSSSNAEEGQTGKRRAFKERRPSFLGSALSQQEHTVINVGRPDGPPRLVSCVRYSQGFEWNQEIFLPSHSSTFRPFGSISSSPSPPLERRREVVHEIRLTDEDVRGLLPE